MPIIDRHVSLKKRQFRRGHEIMRPRIAPAALFAARVPPARAATPAPGAWRRSLGALGRLVVRSVRNGVNAWMMRRAIESLQALDDRTLADIGMHRSEIEHAVRQQVTHHW
jgi:uncharacterized protein YjiS (DUF1127 family)